MSSCFTRRVREFPALALAWITRHNRSVTSEYYTLRRTTIRDLTAFFAFLAGWIGSAAFAWSYLVVGWETGHFTRGVFYFLLIAFGTAIVSGVGGLILGGAAAAAWEKRHRYRRAHRTVSGTEADWSKETSARAAGHLQDDAPTRSRALDSSIRFESGQVDGASFIKLAHRVWPRSYDAERVDGALQLTTNIGAWDSDRLVGTVRVLTDGYLFATVPEILVDPDYRGRGIGRELMRRALDAAPGGALFLGAQPESVGFFERIGCHLGPTGFVLHRRPGS